VTDESGTVLTRYAYDAWGKQSTLYSNTGSGITNLAPSTRGFTDHEMLNDFGLIHMNGRVYDATLGRFISADPNVDGASDSQGYNRYCYCGNNPLNHTDPTGYFSFGDVLKIVAIVVVGIVTAGAALYGYAALMGGSMAGGLMGAISSLTLASGWGVGYAIAVGVGAGFGTSFAASLLNGGSVGDAFKAGVIGGIVGGISAGLLHGIGTMKDLNWFGKGLAHGLVQGGASEATGGQFRHGFYAGFTVGASEEKIGGLTGNDAAKGITAAAVVGGTASAIGGGKFANGAVEGAFSYLFNHLSTTAHHIGDIDYVDIKVDVISIYTEDFEKQSKALDSILELADSLKDVIPLFEGSPGEIMSAFVSDKVEGEFSGGNPVEYAKLGMEALGKNVDEWPPFIVGTTITYRVYLGEQLTSSWWSFGLLKSSEPIWTNVKTEYADVLVPGLFKTFEAADTAGYNQLRRQVGEIRLRSDAYSSLYK